MIRVEIDKSYKGDLDKDIEDLVEVISKELELLSELPISKELDIVIKVNDSIEVLGVSKANVDIPLQYTWNPNPFYNKVLQELRGYYLSLWIGDCINNNLIPKNHIRLLEGRLGYRFEYCKDPIDKDSFSIDNDCPIVETRYQETSKETRYIVLVSRYSPYADLLKGSIDFNPTEVIWIEELKSITNDNPFSMLGISSTRLIRVNV